MSHKLIVLCDGTWNTAALSDTEPPTNVAKLKAALDAAADGAQKAVYLHGVGKGWSARIGRTWRWFDKLTGNSVDRIFGGSSGWGLSRQVREGYAFLAQQYAPRDEIFIFGFSRGAFAARSLVGLLKHAGLVHNSKLSAVRRIAKAYHRRLRGRKHADFLDSVRRDNQAVRVRFLGVWDTVGALGAPIFGGSFSLNPFLKPRFHDVNAFDIVDEGRHAVAIDEQRAAYTSVFFQIPQNDGRAFEQVWFRGVHCDVGGGYLESGLADLALGWMVNRAREAGLRIETTKTPSSTTEAPLVLHDSLGTFWLAGAWPRPFPPVSSRDDPRFDPAWGFVHASVNQFTVSDERRLPGKSWLLDLEIGEETDSIEINASAFWNNTRVVMENKKTYQISAMGEWHVGRRLCGANGHNARRRRNLRATKGNTGELILSVNGSPVCLPPSGKFLWSGLKYLLFEDPPQLTSLLEPWTALDENATRRTMTAKRTGVLHCFANSPWAGQRANAGSISIRVKRIA